MLEHVRHVKRGASGCASAGLVAPVGKVASGAGAVATTPSLSAILGGRRVDELTGDDEKAEGK